MRFRLATTGDGGQRLQEGIGSMFQAMALAPLYRAQGAEDAQAAEAKNQLVQAQTAHYQSQIGKNFAEAALKQREADLLGARPDMLAMMGATRAGMDMPTFQAALNERRYGAPTEGPPVLTPAIPGLGPSGRTSQFEDAVLSLYGPAMATPADKTNWDQLASARGRFQQQGAFDQVLGGQRSAASVGLATAASEGKPLVDNITDTGMGFNRYTGQGVQLDPGLRAIFGGKSDAEVRQRNAAAANSFSGAALHRAQADKVRQDMDQGSRTGDLQVVTGQDGAITIVNKRTLTAQPVLDSQGKPVIKGAAGGGGKAMTEGQAKANLFGGRMMESDRILSQLESAGVLRPGNIKSLAEGVAGAVPLMGDSLAAGVGAATNWTQSADQQKVEQARRDFINAVLRRESGAVISPQEFANAEKQYFPQPGDSKAVIEQKRRNRQIATTLMLQEVPEAQRYRPTAAPAPGGAEGSWGAPAGRNVQVDY